MIDLQQALSIIECGDWFGPLRFIKANLTKGSGGEVVEIAKARLCRRREKAIIAKSDYNKSANHHYHFTRNIELPNGEIRKIHPILITHINNNKVI